MPVDIVKRFEDIIGPGAIARLGGRNIELEGVQFEQRLDNKMPDIHIPEDEVPREEGGRIVKTVLLLPGDGRVGYIALLDVRLVDVRRALQQADGVPVHILAVVAHPVARTPLTGSAVRDGSRLDIEIRTGVLEGRAIVDIEHALAGVEGRESETDAICGGQAISLGVGSVIAADALRGDRADVRSIEFLC